MSKVRYDESGLKTVEHLLGYYDQQVLASYRNEPHKYRIESDNFEGRLTATSEYCSELESAGKTDEFVSIRFGYRTLHDGSLAIVAWLPDLIERSKAHLQKWSAFRLIDPKWTKDSDERFENWVLRYLEGSWEVDSGPLHHLAQLIRVINSLATVLVEVRLFQHEPDETLGYPAAENTHRYQDSHKALYGYLVDGLSKECISCLASKLGRNVQFSSKKTIEAITAVFPSLQTSPNFMAAFDLVSKQRRTASHGVRPACQSFPAFSSFGEDLTLCVRALKELLGVLEYEFGISGENAHARIEAQKWLPQIDRQPEAHYSIVRTSRMTGKTIEKVEFGVRKKIEGVHESEALVIHFTDGSIMSLETGSNAENLAARNNGLRSEDFHVDFMVHWVPDVPKSKPKPIGSHVSRSSGFARSRRARRRR